METNNTTVLIAEDAQKTINSQSKIAKIKNIGYLVYTGYLLSFVIFFLFLLSGLLAYYGKRKAKEINNEILIQNFVWQIRTFWGVLSISILLVLLALIFIGFGTCLSIFLGFCLTIWFLYRIFKGWIYLYKNKPLYKFTFIKENHQIPIEGERI